MKHLLTRPLTGLIALALTTPLLTTTGATATTPAPARLGAAALPPGEIVPSIDGFGKTAGSFSVSDDGASRYKIPLWVPDGRGTAEPELSLSYDSRAGNGLLGVGWSLSGLSSIAPCAKTIAQDGHTDGVQYDGSDAFCLNGTRLLPITPLPPPPAELQEREYRTEQESFAKIVGFGMVKGVPSFFKAWTKDRKVLTFGQSADSRRQAFQLTKGAASYTLVKKSDKRVTLAWDLNRIEDRSGNAATIEYERYEGSSTELWHVESRPKAIKYAPNREVRFSYGGRSDPIESYGRGVHVEEPKRLTKVLVLGGPQGGEIELLRQYLLDYEQDDALSITGRSLLRSVAECDGDDRCKQPVTFDWSKGNYDLQPIDTPVDDGGQHFPIEYPGWPADEDEWAVDNQIVVGDYDGDGRHDILYPNTDHRMWVIDATDTPPDQHQQHWFVRLSTGSGFGSARPAGFAPPKYDCFSPPPGSRPGECTAAEGRVHPIDVDLDGKLEILVWVPVSDTQSRWRLLTFNGTAFVPHSSGLQGPVETGNYPDPVVFADLDGNGTPDFVTAPENHRAWDGIGAEAIDGPWSFRLNTGKAGTARFAAAVNTGRMVPTGRVLPEKTIRVVDTNVDGRADVVGASEYDAGSGWGLNAAGGVETRAAGFGLPYFSDAADVNGDGIEDSVRPYTKLDEDIPNAPQGELVAGLGSGTGYASLSDSPTDYWEPEWKRIPPPPPGGEPDPGRRLAAIGFDRGVRYADFNGDGADDVLVFHPGDPANGQRGQYGAQLYVWRGGKFVWAPLEHDAQSSGKAGKVLDIDGDGMLDILHVQPDLEAPDDEPKGHLRILKRTGGVPDQLVGIGDAGRRERIEIDYTNLNDGDVHSPRTTCVFPQVCLDRGGSVVEQHRTWTFASTGGEPGWDRYDHSYVGAKTDTLGRGSLGVETHIVTRVLTGAETHTAFDNTTRDAATRAYPFAGLAREVTTNVNDSPTGRRHQTDSLTEYEVRRHPGGGYSVEPGTVTAMERERPVSGGSWVTLRQNTTTNLFDDYGNVAKATSVTTGGRTVVEDPTFRNDTVNWLLGLPTRTSTRACTENNECTTRVTGADYDDKGRQTLAVVEPDRAEFLLKTETTYDQFGNVTSAETSDAAGSSRTNRFEYADTDKVHPTATINTLNHKTLIQTHSGLGVPLRTTDPNGVAATMTYDGFGRPRGTNRQDGSFETITHGLVTSPGAPLTQVTATTVSGGSRTESYADPLDRTFLSKVKAFDGTMASTSTRYDPLGRARLVSRPKADSEQQYRYATTEYDNLDRPTKVTAPDGVVTRTDYVNNKTYLTNGRGIVSTTETNVDGEVAARFEDDPDAVASLRTGYEYGPFGELTKVVAADDTEQIMGYDVLGRRNRLDDASSGVTRMTYTAFGEVETETDGNGDVTTYGYDTLGRIKTSTSPDGTTTNVWDTALHGKGLLAKATSTDGVVSVNTYTGESKPETSTWTVAGTGYQIGYDYDALGRRSGITYPAVPGAAGRLAVGYSYNAAGYLEQVRDRAPLGPVYWTAVSRNSAGQLTRENLGNDTSNLWSYDASSGLVDTIQSTIKGFPQIIDYLYDDNRNVTRRITNNGRSETYDYDTLDRLKNWTLTYDGTTTKSGFAYDDIGNLKVEKVEGHPDRDVTYRHGEEGAPPHALNARNGVHYGFDDAGRQISGDGRNITYNRTGLPRTMTWGQGQRTDFQYDAGGARVLKQDDDAGIVTIGGLFERRSPAGTGSTEVHNLHNIVVDGRVVAQVDRPQASASGSTGTPVVTYLHPDLQGSTTQVTNAAGRRVDNEAGWLREIFYDPFGRRTEGDGTPLGNQRRGGPHQGYTAHEHDDEFGLINMKGRIYDPEQRRFLTPDSLIPDPLSSQSYNRYAYVNNNPATNTDPTGHLPDDIDVQTNSSYSELEGTNRTIQMDVTDLSDGRRMGMEIEAGLNSGDGFKYVGNGGPDQLNSTPASSTRSDGDSGSRASQPGSVGETGQHATDAKAPAAESASESKPVVLEKLRTGFRSSRDGWFRSMLKKVVFKYTLGRGMKTTYAEDGTMRRETPAEIIKRQVDGPTRRGEPRERGGSKALLLLDAGDIATKLLRRADFEGLSLTEAFSKGPVVFGLTVLDNARKGAEITGEMIGQGFEWTWDRSVEGVSRAFGAVNEAVQRPLPDDLGYLWPPP